MHLYPAWWRRHFLAAELGVSVLAALLLFVWWKWGHGAPVLKTIVHGNRGTVYGTLATLFGSLLGFVITALSVVLGLVTSERLKILRDSKYYKQLWDVFTSAIRVLGLTTTGWIIALFFDRDTAERPLILVVSLALSLLGAFRLARCVWVLERLVEVLTASAEV